MLLLSNLLSYLTDPIFLFGLLLAFCLFLIKYLLKTKRIKELPAGLSQKVPPMVWQHGYLLGLLVMVSGIMLKHKELQLAEQQNAMSQLIVEYSQNISTIRQLSENTTIQLETRAVVTNLLRTDGSRILDIMFPKEIKPENTDLNITKVVDDSFEQLKKARLFNSKPDMDAFNSIKGKISPKVNMHLAELKSMQDINGDQYIIKTSIYQGHKEILASIESFDAQAYEELIFEMEELRSQYDLVLNHAEDFISETKNFMDRNTFIGNGDAYEILTKERLAYKSLTEFDAAIIGKANDLVRMKQNIQSFL